jgi:hypothetical protein
LDIESGFVPVKISRWSDEASKKMLESAFFMIHERIKL